MSTPRKRWCTTFVGPGHARHAHDGERVLCGADKRRRKDGTLPVLNHDAPWDPADVDCKRCRKSMEVSP